MNYFLHDSEKWPCFSKMTHRIESFFFEYDAKNWILFLWIWRKELNPLFKVTRRIEPSRKNCSKTWTFFFWIWLKESNPFFECDSKNRTFFWMWLKNWNFWLKKIVNKLNSFQKIWPKELNFFSQNDAKIVFFQRSDSKKGTFLKICLNELNFSNKNMTQRIEPFLLWLRELIFLRLKELNFSSNMAQRIALFLLVWVKELVFS